MTTSVYTTTYKYFRELLVEQRHSKNLTQIELAKLINRPQSFVSKYESGERRLDIIEFIEIAEVLGIDIDSFIFKLKEKVVR